MNGWMDRWIDGLMDGWMNGCMDGWIDGWMDGWYLLILVEGLVFMGELIPLYTMKEVLTM